MGMWVQRMWFKTNLKLAYTWFGKAEYEKTFAVRPLFRKPRSMSG